MAIRHSVVKTRGERGYASEWNADHIITEEDKSKRSASIIIAASDSKDKTKADYVCDGNNDQVEIINAIQSLPAGGGRILLLEGTYHISDYIETNKAVHIQGQGSGTILRVADNVPYDINVLGFYDVEHAIVSNLQIKGMGLLRARNGIYAESVDGLIIINCSINGFSGAGVLLLNSYRVKIIGNLFASSDIGINTQNLQDSIISGNTLKDCKNGLILYGSSTANVVACNSIKESDYDAIIVDGSSYNTITGNSIRRSSQSSNNTYSDVVLKNTSTYNIISDNIILEDGYTKSKYGIVEDSTNDDYNIVLCNVVQGAVTQNILVQGSHTISEHNQA